MMFVRLERGIWRRMCDSYPGYLVCAIMQMICPFQGRRQGVCLGGGGAKCLATAARAQKFRGGGGLKISFFFFHNGVGYYHGHDRPL